MISYPGRSHPSFLLYSLLFRPVFVLLCSVLSCPGGISKGDLKKMMSWAAAKFGFSVLQEIADAKPTAELRPIAEGEVGGLTLTLTLTIAALLLLCRVDSCCILLCKLAKRTVAKRSQLKYCLFITIIICLFSLRPPITSVFASFPFIFSVVSTVVISICSCPAGGLFPTGRGRNGYVYTMQQSQDAHILTPW